MYRYIVKVSLGFPREEKKFCQVVLHQKNRLDLHHINLCFQGSTLASRFAVHKMDRPDTDFEVRRANTKVPATYQKCDSNCCTLNILNVEHVIERAM